ncbi:MAG: tyrosine-protein phosphatase [Eubacteriales bacterium]
MNLTVKGLMNARDLGGIFGYGGRKIKTGRIIRSANLALLEKEGCGYFENYGLKKVVDFRTEAEIASSPDAVVNGVEYVRCPILKDLTVGITRKDDLKKRDVAEIVLDLVVSMGKGGRAWMSDLYVPLISDDFALTGYRKFLDVMKDNKSGAVLYHCTVGKDRVGVGTSLLLMILGVSRVDIIKDYLITNDSMRGATEAAMALGRERGVDEEIIENIPYINGVDAHYLDRVFNFIDTEYGTLENFLEKRMGIDEKYVEEMRNNYLE